MADIVGVIGLGIMGGAFARNLVKAGWRVIGFDIDAGRRAAAAEADVEVVGSAAAVAGYAPTIITSLPSAAALNDTARAIAESNVARRVLVETSTLALDDKARAETMLRPGGHVLLDCPVSGTGAQAQRKDLVVYASGDPGAIASLQRLFAGFAREAHDVGAFGNGSRMKFIANLLVAIHNVAAAEAMVLAMKAGLDPKQVVRLIGAGVGSSKVFEQRAPMMAEGVYEPPTMKLSLWQKDMTVIGAFAAALQCPTPLFAATEPIYAAAVATGHGAHDTGAVCAVLEAMAGVTREPAQQPA